MSRFSSCSAKAQFNGLQLVKLSAAILLAVTASQARAASIPIVNSDFETVLKTGTSTPATITPIAFSGTGTVAGFGTNVPFTTNTSQNPYNVDVPGWVSQTVTTGFENLGSLIPSDLTNVGYLGIESASPSSFSQLLAANVGPNELYTLSVDVNRRTDQASTGPGGSQFPLTFAASLRGGATPLVATGPASYVVPGAGDASTYTISFNTNAIGNLGLIGQPLEILFSTATGQVNLDNVTLSAVPAPEPSTAVLAVIGAVVCGWGVCRRQRRA